MKQSRIAHLSDVHLLSDRDANAFSELRMRFVSFGRPLDVDARRKRLARALAYARAEGATTYVLTGDLTEMGRLAQFEVLAEVLHDSKIDPDDIILLPGNHDAYTSCTGWAEALHGPLAAFERGAAIGAGKLLDRGDFMIAPIDVTVFQPVTRSAGELTAHDAAMFERSVAGERRPIVAAVHHHPFPHSWRAWQWFDGLRGWEHLDRALARHPNLSILHGHLHYEVERGRIFGTTATVEDRSEMPRVRFYDVGEIGLDPALRPGAQVTPPGAAFEPAARRAA